MKTHKKGPGAKKAYGTKVLYGKTTAHIGAGPSKGAVGVVRPMGGLV